MAEIYKSKFPGQEIDERLELIPELQEGVEAAQQAADGKYTKPASGIPMTDLSDEVREAIEEGGGQADWAQTDTTAPDYIKNKPSIPTHVVRFVQQFLSDSEQIQARANIGAGTYTKPSGGIPESDLADDVVPDVSDFITNTVNNLVNYYLKSETYSRSEVQQLIAAIQGVSFVSVASLPTPSADTMGGKIYLVPSANPDEQNVKDEFITIQDGNTYTWEQIGSTAVNLSGYVTTQQLNNALVAYTTTEALTTLLAAKQDTISDLSAIRSGAAAGATAYQKPQTGIPASDLAPGVIPTVPTDVVKYSSQSLSDAQKTQARTNIGAAAAAALTALETAIAAKYTKPSSGIPETDLAANVQSALALARTSIQSLADYYDKTEIDSLLAAVSSEQYVDVPTLPTASASTLGKIYLVGPDANNQYARYYTSYDGSAYSWVAAGTTEINLALYATKEELSQLEQEVDEYVFEEVPASKNILDPFTDVKWKTSLSSTGAEQASANYNSSTYLPVEPGVEYVSSQNGYVIFYNAEKVKVGSRKELTATSRTFTTPNNAVYIRVAIQRQYWQSAYINKGTLEPAKDNYAPASEYNKIDKNAEDIIGLENLLYRTGYVPITDFITGAYIKTITYPGDVADVENPVEASGYAYLILPVSKGDSFRLTGTGGTNGRLFVFTDTSYTIVQYRASNATDTNAILTAPIDGYFIVNFVTQYPHSLERVVTELAIDVAVQSDFDRGPFTAFAHRFATRYRGLQESYPDRIAVGQNTSYAEAIALMDGLVTAGAGYVTKTALGTGEGTDGSGNPYTIYDYAFIPPTAPNSNVKGKRPVVMIDACLHGFEKTAFYGWYFFFKDVIENWEENPSLAAIRSGVEIHFIPVANPWGFDNDIRNNYNGVNLNRNFPVPNWEPVAEGSDASGAEPFDQAESAVIRDWLDAHPDAFLLIDTHTNGHYNASGWVEANHNILVTDTNDEYYNKMFNAAQRHIEDNTVVFAKNYSLSITPRFGQFHSNLSTTTNGYICVYGATERKMLATTLEGFNGLIVNEEQVVGLYSTTSKKMNSEIFGNYLLDMLEEFMK